MIAATEATARMYPRRLDHVRQARSQRAERPEQVDLDRALRGGRIDDCERTERADARVRDQDVDAAVALDRGSHRALERRGAGHVRRKRERTVATLAREAVEWLAIEVEQRQLCPAPGKQACGLGPDAACGSGDEHDLSLDRLGRHGPRETTQGDPSHGSGDAQRGIQCGALGPRRRSREDRRGAISSTACPERACGACSGARSFG